MGVPTNPTCGTHSPSRRLTEPVIVGAAPHPAHRGSPGHRHLRMALLATSFLLKIGHRRSRPSSLHRGSPGRWHLSMAPSYDVLPPEDGRRWSRPSSPHAAACLGAGACEILPPADVAIAIRARVIPLSLPLSYSSACKRILLGRRHSFLANPLSLSNLPTNHIQQMQLV